MARFDNAIALALRLIQKNGRTITVRRYLPAALPDANKPWETGSPTPHDQPTVGAFFNYEKKYIDGTTIVQGDQEVLVPAAQLTVEPEINGEIITSTETWKIIDSQPLNVNGQAIIYIIQARR